MKTDTSERGLERSICTSLTGSPCDPVLATADMEREAAAPAGGTGWICGNPDEYDREYCVDLTQLLAFLVETQPDAFEGLQLEEDGPARRKFLARLQGEISKRGVIDVLRKGVKHERHDLDLFYGTPSAGNLKAREGIDSARRGAVDCAPPVARFTEDLSCVRTARERRAAKKRVAGVLRKMGALKGLSPRNTLLVVRHVFIMAFIYQFNERGTRSHRQPASVAPPMPASARPPKPRRADVNRLNRKITKTQAAIDALSDEIDSIVHDERLEWMAMVVDLALLQQVEALSDLASQVSEVGFLIVEPSQRPARDRTFEHNRNTAICELFDLLTRKCGMHRGLASALTARIDSTFWGGSVSDTDFSSGQKRSPAILKIVKRHSKRLLGG